MHSLRVTEQNRYNSIDYAPVNCDSYFACKLSSAMSNELDSTPG